MHHRTLLMTGDAAQRLGVSASWLHKIRVAGGGPRFAKLGAKVLYDPADLEAWLEERKYNSTSEFTESGR
jgi:predicted DNA-binding transcriptional regulator AlpA